MSARGRGNTTAKRGMPNLALAGKREEGKTQNRENKTPRGGSRGGRGGQRGGRGGGKFVKQGLITTEGIFSEGLHAQLKQKRDVEQTEFARNSRNGIEKAVKEEAEQMEVDESGKTSFEGWEAEWRSDSEEDRQVLGDLIGGDDFISDYKRGDRLPIVLPTKDEEQYQRLMSKSAKIHGDVMEEKYSLDAVRDPTSYLSRRAGETMNKLFFEEGDKGLIFLQLPTVVNHLTSISTPLPAVKTENGEQPTIASDTPSKNAVPDLPKGRKIGKLQITKSGRVILRVGDVTLDVTTAAPPDLQENAILLETRPEQSGTFYDSGSNAVYHVGEVKHHFIASANWSNLKSEQTSDEKPATVAPTKPDTALLDELRALDLETANWAADAERWASPY